jgi:hypothetical protein
VCVKHVSVHREQACVKHVSVYTAHGKSIMYREQAYTELTCLGYLVVDLHWSRWVRSEDVVGQCCLRT